MQSSKNQKATLAARKIIGVVASKVSSRIRIQIMAQYIALAASAFSIIGPALKKKDSAGKVAGGISINSSTSRSSVGFSTGLGEKDKICLL